MKPEEIDSQSGAVLIAALAALMIFAAVFARVSLKLQTELRRQSLVSRRAAALNIAGAALVERLQQLDGGRSPAGNTVQHPVRHPVRHSIHRLGARVSVYAAEAATSGASAAAVVFAADRPLFRWQTFRRRAPSDSCRSWRENQRAAIARREKLTRRSCSALGAPQVVGGSRLYRVAGDLELQQKLVLPLRAAERHYLVVLGTMRLPAGVEIAGPGRGSVELIAGGSIIASLKSSGGAAGVVAHLHSAAGSVAVDFPAGQAVSCLQYAPASAGLAGGPAMALSIEARREVYVNGSAEQSRLWARGCGSGRDVKLWRQIEVLGTFEK